MHRSNAEWLWNGATNNQLALPIPNTFSMHRSSSLSSNAIITDVGICVGMRNVNLNGESTCFIENIPHCCKYSIPRPLLPPNWYKNYAHYLRRDETLTKYHQSPVVVSNGLNALVVNEYSSANMRNEIIKFRQSLPTANTTSPVGNFTYTGESELTTQPTQSNPVTAIRDEISEPTLAPPKKKWIRHYMMGEKIEIISYLS